MKGQIFRALPSGERIDISNFQTYIASIVGGSRVKAKIATPHAAYRSKRDYIAVYRTQKEIKERITELRKGEEERIITRTDIILWGLRCPPSDIIYDGKPLDYGLLEFAAIPPEQKERLIMDLFSSIKSHGGVTLTLEGVEFDEYRNVDKAKKK